MALAACVNNQEAKRGVAYHTIRLLPIDDLEFALFSHLTAPLPCLLLSRSHSMKWKHYSSICITESLVALLALELWKALLHRVDGKDFEWNILALLFSNDACGHFPHQALIGISVLSLMYSNDASEYFSFVLQ